MINKKDSSDPIDNLEYEKVLEEEIINSYESKFLKDTQLDKKKTLTSLGDGDSYNDKLNRNKQPHQ